VHRLGQLVYFMAPAYAANMAPPFVKYWPWPNRPISERWLGGHKTVVGFAAGVLAACTTALAQSRMAVAGALVGYDDWLGLGLRFGLGAMAGDSLKSFLKRRAGIRPGAPWIPFDQLDFALGALVLVWPRVSLSALDVLAILAFTAAGHIAVDHVGYWLGLRESRW
jgi:CDP-2,3-bis-(O-geranylgeranyl)-sn-glycerol synthase